MTLVRLFLWPLWHVALVSAPWSFKPASLSGYTWLAPTSQIPLHCPRGRPPAPGRAAAQRDGAPASPCTSVSGSQWLDERIGELTGNKKYTLTLQGHETDRYPLSSSQWFLNTSLACFLRLYTEKKCGDFFFP